MLRDLDVSQHVAAAAIGMSQQSLSSRIRGRTPFSAEEVLALAEHLGVPVSELMDEPGPPARMEAPPSLRAPRQAIPA